KSNSGPFRAMFATAEAGKNDYEAGLNVDFGPAKTDSLSVLNVESAGASGARDLLVPDFSNTGDHPFGKFHVFTVRSRVAKAGTEMFLDGVKSGERDRHESMIGLDQMVLGARLLSHESNQPPFPQGFFDGAIAEVLIYDRALSDSERQAVEQALLAKVPALHALLNGERGHALQTVANPPVVQMLVPGFTVQELPLKIGNLNNVRYRHDGKLVGLGYDGRIFLITDSDGDGLEDKAEVFWDQPTLQAPVGIALTPKGDPRGEGVFVASKGKMSLILDKDRDGKAEEEIVLASGWPGTFAGVDATGVAIDPKDGSIYFGIGCANFADGYQIDKKTGRSTYDIHSPRGTIQRISADFSKRETVCTGIRFACALAFNRFGDLFATEQEGATWLPNGNPLDELLHIEKGKHYGFPPRHPKHLPDVRDVPAVMEYGPQHQSVVGMVFNEGVNGGPHFGPAHWKDDALICGEARGKIWRTKLAKTPHGYVAQNHLIACLNLLTVDNCVTPAGDLLIACHSGPPDWGTGPAGEGRLFKIRYTGKEVPQPVQAWAAASDEFRVSFDRPLDPTDWAFAKADTKIEAGAFVSAGDRFETVRPGYQVVRDQMSMPRRWVDVQSVGLSEDRRTLVVRVPRQTEPVNYAISLPLPAAWKQESGIYQHPQIDVMATLNGVAAAVTTAAGQELRTVLPHAAPKVSAAFTAGSAEHEAVLKAAAEPGSSVKIRALVDASNPFVPAVQPGSTLDWDMTKDAFASMEFEVWTDLGSEQPSLVATEKAGRFQQIDSLATNLQAKDVSGLFVARQGLQHSISTARLHVPWSATTATKAAPGTDPKLRTDVKGDWLRGRRLFFGEAGCAACHTVRGEGLVFGPDLSNLVHRDRDSVLHDILQPSATINPDQIGTVVKFKDGTEISGIVRKQDDEKVILSLPGGTQSEHARATVASMEPLKGSLMPAELIAHLTPEQREDLLTFLLSNPLEPAPITRTEPPMPPARSIAEVNQVLAAAGVQPDAKGKPLHILLCGGPKDHGPDEHDYPLWLERWSRLLALGENVIVSTSNGFPTAEQLAKADVAVFYNANAGWNAERAAMLDVHHKRGGGVVYIHWAVEGGKEPDAAAERCGLAFTLGSRFRHGNFDLVFPQPDHPITRGFPTLRFTDETYWAMRGDTSRLNILGTAIEDNAPQPELWTLERHNSRIVACIPGHYTWTFDDPLFRVLVLRSICCAAKEANVDRLAELATVGARVAP
ncbi:MAG: ThuA domain-containing protein, partial [Chthoniobacteraceae bacterium]